MADEQSVGEEAPPPVATSTEPEPVAEARIRRWRSLRRVFFVALCVYIGLGLLNVYGVRTSDAVASGGATSSPSATPASPAPASSLRGRWRSAAPVASTAP